MVFSMPVWSAQKTQMPICSDTSGVRNFLQLICGLMMLVCLAQAVHARGMEIVEARTSLVDGVYVLDARIRIRLHDELVEAIQNGVALPVILEIELVRERNYLWNETIAQLRQRYELRYHALSKQYILSNLNSGVQESHFSLERALLDMGRVRELPLLDRDLLEEGETYQVRLRAGISTEDLPIPLRLLSYVYGKWRMESDWHSWPL